MIDYIASILDMLLGPKKISSKEISFDELIEHIRDTSPERIHLTNYSGGYPVGIGGASAEKYTHDLEKYRSRKPNVKLRQTIFVSRAKAECRFYRVEISNH